MSKDCLDIGIIQGFLDGELAPGRAAMVSDHITGCDNCAILLAQAEEESAVVFPVLDCEMNTLVPTQRLWNKINDTLATERENRSFWRKAIAFFSIGFATPSFTAATSLLLVAAIAATVWINRSSNPADGNVPVSPVRASDPVAVGPAPPSQTKPTRGNAIVVPSVGPSMSVERSSYRVETPRNRVRKQGNSGTIDVLAFNGYLPGEQSYIRTISSLNGTVRDQKDSVLRPSERMAYERDMAVVDDTIAKMRLEVKKNPKNESAKQVLYSSYQNKIDLLNSVSQQQELVASLR
jgi:hypothetical protein